MKISQKKDWAKLLYLKGNLTQKEIAAKVIVTEATLSKWINLNEWEILRSSFTITKEQELRRIYIQINELNDTINEREKGKRYASSKEADILSKLAATAKSLEAETSVAEIINVSIGLLDYVKEKDYKKAQEISIVFDEFIKYKLSKF